MFAEWTALKCLFEEVSKHCVWFTMSPESILSLTKKYLRLSTSSTTSFRSSPGEYNSGYPVLEDDGEPLSLQEILRI
jgi:hypothetical protein